MTTFSGPIARRRGRAAAIAALAPFVLAFAGCGEEPEPGTPDAAPTAGTTVAPGDAAASQPPPVIPPEDDAASEAAALDTGTQAVLAFARPDLSEELWWAGLAPMLTPTARVAYEGTDPAEIPVREVTGPAGTGPSPSPFLATVVVPTDAGEYAVLLVREGAGAPWLVERIAPLPPEGAEDGAGTATPGTTATDGTAG